MFPQQIHYLFALCPPSAHDHIENLTELINHKVNRASNARDNIIMIKEFTVQGTWSFPGHSDDDFCGKLTYTPSSGGLLQITGLKKHIKKLFRHVMSNKRQQETIVGKTLYGYMTLVDSYCHGWPQEITSDEMTVELVFHTRTVLYGDHFHQKADIKFSRLQIRYTNLDEWALISGIDLSDAYDSDDDYDCVVRFRFPKTLEAKIRQFKAVKSFQIYIRPFLQRPENPAVNKKACITQFYQVIIETSDPVLLETLEEVLYNFRNFLSLAVRERVFPTLIQAQSETDPFNKIEVFYQLPHFTSEVPDIWPFTMLFTLPDISDHFEETLNNWFEKADLLEPVLDLYFGIRHNPYVYNIHSFLSLVQALETYHMRFAEKYKLSDEASTRLLSDVNKISDQPYDKEWNRKPKNMTLLRRILEILNYYDDISWAICYEPPVPFSKKVADDRNYYTHYDPQRPQLKHKVTRGIELSVVARRLDLILEVCLLSELGFGRDEITKRFREKNKPLLDALAMGMFPSSETPFSRL